MNRKVKKVWDIVSSVLVGLVVLLAVLLVGARLVGLQVFTVLSGSMEPTYHTGSLIYVKKVDPYTIKEGQPITFLLDENTVATHRVVGIVPDEEDPTVIRFRTKGDANEAEDGGLVHYKNVIGTPIFSIPRLGYLAEYIQHPPGMYVAISVGAILLLLVFLPDIFSEDNQEETPKKQRPPRKAKASRRKQGAFSQGHSPRLTEVQPPPSRPAPAPEDQVPQERTEQLRRAARKLLPPEEYQALTARLAQGPLTREEYRRVYHRVKAQRDAQAGQ